MLAPRSRMMMEISRCRCCVIELMLTLFVAFSPLALSNERVADRGYSAKYETARAETSPRYPVSRHERPLDTAPVTAGFVIWDGRYIPPPYTVSEQDDQLYLNGQRLPSVEPAMKSPGHGSPRSGRFGPMSPRAMVRHTLERNGLLVVAADHSLTIRPEFTSSFLGTLLSDQGNAEKIENLSQQGSGFGSQRAIEWTSLVSSFLPNQDLRDRYRESFPPVEVGDIEDSVDQAAPKWIELQQSAGFAGKQSAY